jgi:hypothetical protein
MPVINNVGVSDNTPKKQKTLQSILDVHTRIVGKIINKPNSLRYAEPHYLYIDLNSGPGKYGDIDGSPLVFKNTANANRVPYIAILSEINKNNCDSLGVETSAESGSYCHECGSQLLKSSNVTSCFLNGGGWGIICNEDNTVTLDSVIDHYRNETIKKPYGMVYVDPNNHEARFKHLETLFANNRMRYLDLLIHVSGTIIKRLLHTNTTERIIESISGINKKYWLIRKPYSCWQWTFLLGTNWDGFPEFKNLDFVHVESEEGQEYLKLINNTREELQLQKPIQTTSSILNTRFSGLSEARL